VPHLHAERGEGPFLGWASSGPTQMTGPGPAHTKKICRAGLGRVNLQFIFLSKQNFPMTCELFWMEIDTYISLEASKYVLTLYSYYFGCFNKRNSKTIFTSVF